MKKIFKYTALVCASAAVAISCVEENLEPIIPAVDGDAIVFGVRAGFEDSAAGTKTEYSGKDYTTEDGKKFERIDWIENDKIEIYSPEAENPYSETSKSTHYRVTGFSVGDENAGETGKGSDYAQLANVGDAGLRWNGTQIHNFYAMYPSSEMFRAADGQLPSTIEAGVKMGLDKETGKKIMVYGVIPSSQQPEVTAVTGGYVAKPDMDYAYMVAKTSVDPTKSNSVKLSFVPIVTAVEIELVNNSGEAISIGEIQLASEEQIHGEFTADLSSSWTNGYPTCVNIAKALPEGATTYDIQISTYMRSEDNYHPVTLQDGEFMKFTAFLLPGAIIEDLIVRVSQMGVGYAAKNLPNANIPKNLKTRIKGLNLPEKEDIIFGGDNWMEQIKDPEVSFKTLSLPGTGGSFTSTASADFRQQELTFQQQWTQGIRAFELSSDRGGGNNSSGNLGEQSILCNKVPVAGWTVAKAIKEILAKVTTIKDESGNLSETAALILTYQPVGYSPNRNVSRYADALKTLLTAGTGDNRLTQEQIDCIIPYTKDLSLKDARGKLILICRPNQRDENDNGTYSSSSFDANHVTVVNGCGTAKDRWGARGYRVTSERKFWTQGTSWQLSSLGYNWAEKVYNGETAVVTDRALDISNNPVIITEQSHSTPQRGATRKGYDVSYVEQFMSNKNFNIFKNGNSYVETSGNISIGVTKPELNKPSVLKFGYETNIPGTTCWFQEWARVIPESSTKQAYSGTWTDGSSFADFNIYWFESYKEKLSNILTTFDMAISGDYPDYVFINSLCGYLATEETHNMYPNDPSQNPWSLAPSMGGAWGGAGGDIDALAELLNPAFYNHVLSSGMENKTGPTGIILMDFVSNEESKGASFALPAVIISNNFKYDNVGGTTQTPPGDQVGGGENGGVIPF